MGAKKAASYLTTSLLLPVVVFGLIKHIASPVTGFADDDSWFYAQIAHSWPHAGFPTFDGIHETSGFHLLWGAILAGLAWCVSLFSDDKAVHAAAYISVYLLIVIAVVDLATAKSPHRRALIPAAFCTLILCAFLMETALLTLVLLLVGRTLEDPGNRPSGLSRNTALLACACALLPLCRFDATLVPLVWAALDRRRQIVLPMILGSAAGALIQLAAMHALFGHWFSVSSMLKVSYAMGGRSAPVGETLNFGTVYRAILALALGLAASFSLRHYPKNLRRVRLGALVGVSCFSLGHIALGSARSWYFFPMYGICWWLMAAPVAYAIKHRGPLRSFSIASLAVALLVGGGAIWKGYRYVTKQKDSARSWNFIEKITQLVPQDGRIYEIDASGFPGYWSDRSVTNGDGLVNSYTYARQLASGQLEGYLEKEGICWLIVTGRVVDRSPGMVLNFNGLAVRASEVETLYPTGKIRKNGTQLLTMTTDHCR